MLALKDHKVPFICFSTVKNCVGKPDEEKSNEFATI
jgi:hypothetical protein